MQKATDKTEIIGIQFGNKHSLKKPTITIKTNYSNSRSN